MEEEHEGANSVLLRVITLGVILVILPVIGLIGAVMTRMTWLAVLGGIALALGVGLVAVIWLAGLIARTNRVLLVVVFAPLLVFTNLALVPLIALNGVVATIAVGAIFPIAGVLMGIAALFGVVTMLGRALSLPIARRGVAPVKGMVVTPEAQPEVWELVHELAGRVGTAPPANIVIGADPNFFVTQAKVVCLDGELKGRTLFLSLPFCRIMTLDELRAVVAHELGHFRGWDTRFSAVFYPVYRGAVTSLVELGEEVGEGISGLPLLPAYMVLGLFLDSFSEAEARLSRTRELAADRVSVEAVGPQVTATALVKIHGFSRYWRRALAVMREHIRESRTDLNVGRFFAEAAEEGKDSLWMRKDLDQEEPLHPTDSHPPLSQRLAALQLTIKDVEHGAFTVTPGEPASTLIRDAEALELQLTQVEKQILIESHQVVEGSKIFR
jgi:Zn-dependent protease with chaperone function